MKRVSEKEKDENMWSMQGKERVEKEEKLIFWGGKYLARGEGLQISAMRKIFGEWQYLALEKENKW